MLRILTWLWPQPGGRAEYTAEHVNIWAAMVGRHLSMPHTLACVTDMPEGIDPSIEIISPPGEFEDVRIPTWSDRRARGLPQCFRRLAMFHPNAGEIFGERFVSMDLDCVIADNLDPLFDHDDDFRMYRGTNAARPYNGSLLQMNAGARPKVYTEFTPERAVAAGKIYLGSDQAWISYVLGWCEKTWGPEHGVQWYRSRQNRHDIRPRLMFFPGTPKPWQVRPSDPSGPWVAAHYVGEVREAA